MRKVPTVFDRDWGGDRSRVLDAVNPECQWVIDGEGAATRKYDGACCMVRAGLLYKRREVAQEQLATGVAGFEPVETDSVTQKTSGWVPVGTGPEDRWFVEAWRNENSMAIPADGTYELVGPKVQGNPERFPEHVLVRHGRAGLLGDVPRTYAGLRDYLAGKDVEGVVFHHPDGRMAKIKLRDFGLKRVKV